MPTYSKGSNIISVEFRPLLGKTKPELYVGSENQLLKVGTFGSEDKARVFCKYLEHFFGLKKDGDV